MAISSSNSITLTAPASSSAEYRLWVSFTETDISESKNKHYITASASLKSLRSGTAFDTSSNHTLQLYWYDDVDNKRGMLLQETVIKSLDGNEEVEISKDFSVEGDDDGDIYGYAVAVWNKASSNIYVPPSDDVETAEKKLTHIDMYAKITKFKVYKVDETSVEIDWDTDETVDRVRYRIDGGAYHNLASNGIVGGLTAGTNYRFEIDVRRKSNGLVTDSDKVYQSTYAYPYGQTLPNFNIGNPVTITLYNPLARTVTASLITVDGQEHGSFTTTGTTITGFNDSTWQNIFVNSIPNAKSGTYRIKVVYSSINTNVSTATGTYTIDNSSNTYSPTFESSNWSYVANLTELTNNNQVVIDGMSTITYTVNTPAVAKYGSSIDFYRYKWGNVSSTTGTVSNGNGNTLEVIAVDTRGFSTSAYLELTNNYINYIPITTTTQNTHREGGAGSNTFLNLVGNMFCNSFGEDGITNEIISGKYYVLQQDSTWSEAYTLDLSNAQYNAENNRFTLENVPIHANGTSGGFVVGQSYTIKVDLTDNVSTYTFTGITVADGKMARDVYKDYNGDYHEGINGLANSNYTQEIHGTLNATNNIYVNGVAVRTTGVTRVILYRSSSGSTSGSLSESVDNFDEIQVYSGNTSRGIVTNSFVPNITPYIISGGYTSAGTSGSWVGVDVLRINFSAKTSFTSDCRYAMDNSGDVQSSDVLVFLVVGIKYN